MGGKNVGTLELTLAPLKVTRRSGESFVVISNDFEGALPGDR